ncbi:MAG: hypothetical protein L0213_03395, partial [Candidatus Dadabacteria bacterium]|nr:hypothetical protein [Candidatus Dadabacteria bacterium]
QGLVNYSALARHIAEEMDLNGSVSEDAIMMAVRRYRDRIRDEMTEGDIIELFKGSNLEIKNNVITYTLEKTLYPDRLIEAEKEIRRERELFLAIEGTRTITVIVQEQNRELIEESFRNAILSKKAKQSLITISSPGIEHTPGAISYVSGLFFENEVNIEELISCYDETLIIIDSRDTGKMVQKMGF